MTCSIEMSWQVLFDDNEWENGWSDEDRSDRADIQIAPVHRARKKKQRRLWIEVGLVLAACAFLIAQFWPQPKERAAASQIERRLESEFFVLYFPHHDLDTVTAFAPRLDARFAQMLRMYGLPIPAEKIVVGIAVNGETAPLWAGPDTLLRTVSPERTDLSPPIGSADATLNSILLTLTEWTIRARLGQMSPGPEYELAPGLAGGLRLWYQWRYGLADPSVRRELVRRHFAHLSSVRVQQLPILVNIHDDRAVSMAHIDQNALVVAALLDYGIQAYGPGCMPLLLDELPDSETWAILVPRAFGVSAGEFEAGWRAWLAEEYGL